MPRTTDEATVRSLLPHAWHAFFGRFGRLTEIQRLAAVPVLSGKNVLVSSPTASGKTEALLAPLVERLRLAERQQTTQVGPRIIVVSPTRALVNDLFRRLRGPLKQVGLETARKTGDAPNYPNLGHESALLVTTPESLDSLLARHPATLRQVSAVVLDELQLLARTARGDQLGCLLARLDRVAKPRPQRCAATATVAEPARLVREFLGPEGQYVSSGGGVADQRSIDGTLKAAATLDDAVAVIAASFLSAVDVHKVLVFANTRAEVEGLVAGLSAIPRLRSQVYAHHGSLSRNERLRVESLLRTASTAICVATMTLELGIDVGDVDLVVLLAPPPDVASLLQRAGRGNRRHKVSRVLGLYQGELELSRFEHLLQCAAAGRLFDEPLTFRPTLLAQQALSLLLQSRRGWVSAEVLHARLPDVARSSWTKSDCRAVLEALVKTEYLRTMEADRYVADEGTRPLFERGRVHSMIEDVREREVIDVVTGRTVGRARVGQKDTQTVLAGGNLKLALGGKRRQVTAVRDEKVFVTSEDGAEQARFLSREAPRYSAALAADFARFLGLEPDTMLLSTIFIESGSQYRLDHYLGTTWGRLLGWLLTASGHKASNAGPFSLILEKPLIPQDQLPFRNDEELRSLVLTLLKRHRRALARQLGAGPFREVVPAELMDRWIAESIDVDALVRRVCAVRVRED